MRNSMDISLLKVPEFGYVCTFQESGICSKGDRSN